MKPDPPVMKVVAIVAIPDRLRLGIANIRRQSRAALRLGVSLIDATLDT